MAPERKRGRPSGAKRKPLSLEERRARNAMYERERRQENAEAFAELAEAVGCPNGTSHKELLAIAVNMINRLASEPDEEVVELQNKIKQLKRELKHLRREKRKRTSLSEPELPPTPPEVPNRSSPEPPHHQPSPKTQNESPEGSHKSSEDVNELPEVKIEPNESPELPDLLSPDMPHPSSPFKHEDSSPVDYVGLQETREWELWPELNC